MENRATWTADARVPTFARVTHDRRNHAASFAQCEIDLMNGVDV